MKKEAAAEEEAEGEGPVTVAGSPGWLEFLSRQEVKVLLLLVVMVESEASAAETSLSASLIKP